VASFAKGVLNMEVNGVDSIDKRILLYLSSNKKKIKPSDVIMLKAFRGVVEGYESKGLKSLNPIEHKEYNRAKFNVTILSATIENAEFVFKSRQDISLACRVLDLRDLEVRLSYLEKLSYITKSSKGISINAAFM
jgi:hypothetical protein